MLLATVASSGRSLLKSCSALGRGPAPGHVHSVVALSEFVLVLGLQAVDSGSAVELAAKHLVGLDEALQLASQVSVLALEALSVLFKSISLGKQITIVRAVLRGRDAEAFNITSDGEQLVFPLLQTDLTVADLN